MPWCNTPPDAILSLPQLLFEKIYGKVAIAFTKFRTLGIREVIVFEATYPRPTRSRAYASPASLPRPSQGSLPARVGSPLAGRVSHPLDDKRSFMKSSHTPILLDQPFLVASKMTILQNRTEQELAAMTEAAVVRFLGMIVAET